MGKIESQRLRAIRNVTGAEFAAAVTTLGMGTADGLAKRFSLEPAAVDSAIKALRGDKAKAREDIGRWLLANAHGESADQVAKGLSAAGLRIAKTDVEQLRGQATVAGATGLDWPLAGAITRTLWSNAHASAAAWSRQWAAIVPSESRMLIAASDSPAADLKRATAGLRALLDLSAACKVIADNGGTVAGLDPFDATPDIMAAMGTPAMHTAYARGITVKGCRTAAGITAAHAATPVKGVSSRIA